MRCFVAKIYTPFMCRFFVKFDVAGLYKVDSFLCYADHHFCFFIHIEANKRMKKITDLDHVTQTSLEAAVLQRLLAHLNTRGDVQNIDLQQSEQYFSNCRTFL